MISEIMTVTQKGQVTIPKKIRKFLGITPRGRMKFTVKDDQVIISSISGVDKLFDKIPQQKKSFTDKEIQSHINNYRYS